MAVEAPFSERLSGWFLDNKLFVAVAVLLLVGAGVYTAPFDWDTGSLPRDPIPVDAIPDIGENQQIVFTSWPGRSPRDVEDQITYPLSTALQGLPGVRTVRGSSMFGFSSIYVIFDDDVEFYWSRSRVLEKLASLPPDLLPDGVTPTLGPDATALGQVFWYTLEGRDGDGNTVGGWDLDELRSIQDWTVRYALQSAPGVSEVASIGGHVREYQVEVDPDALRSAGIPLAKVVAAVRGSNLDVGARTLELNGAEYLVRGLGLIASVDDLEQTVVAVRDHAPIRVADVARVGIGPAQRRGLLDDEGAEAVGGVVTARYGANPMEVLNGVRAKLREIAAGLPSRTLEDGTISKVTIVPFYDRGGLIAETLGTLSSALWQQILVTILVVLVLLRRLRASVIVSAVLPLAVLGAFVVMKLTGVQANIMALAGIAIAIGSMVDMGIVFVENMEQHLKLSDPSEPRSLVLRRAVAEVAPAVLTSTTTTVISFLPVFALTGSDAKLFHPLAFTKSFAIVAALAVAVFVLPTFADLLLRRAEPRVRNRTKWLTHLWLTHLDLILLGLVVLWLLTTSWMPLGWNDGRILNLLFTAVLMGSVLLVFLLFRSVYSRLLAWFLDHKLIFAVLPLGLLAAGLLAWSSLGREYMPPFDEGSFLFMPTTMPHASIGEAKDLLSMQDMLIKQVPEVDRVVGKLGRADSALDPAPVSMFETLITYKPEYRIDDDGERIRQWRDHIRTPADIWTEVTEAARVPGVTDAPFLQPISTRIVMLQTGMRAPMGIKVRGPDLQTIADFALALEAELKQVPELRAETVFAERVVGKPYLNIELKRRAIARYGLTVERVQRTVQTAVGGMTATRTVEGRERYPVLVRYPREERGSIEELMRILVDTPTGAVVPLSQLAELRYERGPQVIKSEDTFNLAVVTFDKRTDIAEVEAVEAARAFLDERIAQGALIQPAGVSFTFAGSYEKQLASEAKLKLLIPIALILVFLLLYLQFRSAFLALSIFSGVAVAASGGFLLLWLYGQAWFLDVSILGTELRPLFGVDTVNLSTAVWVGFIALVGIAVDDGVVMMLYLKQRFADAELPDTATVRALTLEAGLRRIRPCLMTTATTILALLPVITSTGKGGDVMKAMALPVVGGMGVELVTLFVVPVLYAAWAERRSGSRPDT